jgi:hypothetical protein
MPLVLALEPDEKQAVILSGLILNQLRAELELVDAKASAIAAIRRHVPDLVLLSADISPNDERDIAAFLRTLEGADHLKTLTIPKLRIGDESETSVGFLQSFKGRRAISKPQGCEPRVFAKQVRRWLTRAEELKAERRAWPRPSDPPVKMPVIMDAAPRTKGPATPPGDTVPVENRPLPAIREPVATLDLRPAPFGTSPSRLDASIEGQDGSSDDLTRLMSRLKLPVPVAAFSYPRGCRIQQVRLGRPGA